MSRSIPLTCSNLKRVCRFRKSIQPNRFDYMNQWRSTGMNKQKVLYADCSFEDLSSLDGFRCSERWWFESTWSECRIVCRLASAIRLVCTLPIFLPAAWAASEPLEIWWHGCSPSKKWKSPNCWMSRSIPLVEWKYFLTAKWDPSILIATVDFI